MNSSKVGYLKIQNIQLAYSIFDLTGYGHFERTSGAVYQTSEEKSSDQRCLSKNRIT